MIRETRQNWGVICLGLVVLATLFAYFAKVLFQQNSYDYVAPLGISFTIISAWSYGIVLFHASRAVKYRFMSFPALRRESHKHIPPEHLVCLILLYNMPYRTIRASMYALASEVQRCGLPTTIYIAGSTQERIDQEVGIIQNIFQNFRFDVQVEVFPFPQVGQGKRHAMSTALKAIARKISERNIQNSVALVMDGDSVLTPGIFEKTIPLLRHPSKKIGALTIDNLVNTYRENWYYTAWNQLRFLRRNLYLSSAVTVLTGRFALIDGECLTDPRLEQIIGNDSIDHIIFNKIPLLTGDDKSTRHYFHTIGKEVLYVPDSFVYCLEHLPLEKVNPTKGKLHKAIVNIKNYFQFGILSVMLRVQGNMFRGGYRELTLGPKKIGFGMWFTYLDQQIGFWRPLFTPLLIVFLSFEYGGQLLAAYAFFILFTRSIGVIFMKYVLSFPHEEKSISDILKEIFFIPIQAVVLYIDQTLTPVTKIITWWRLDMMRWSRASVKSEKKFSKFDLKIRTFGIYVTFITLGFVAYATSQGIQIIL